MHVRQFFAIAVLALVGGTSPATPTQESAEATVRAFLAALSTGDLATATRYVSGTKPVENPKSLVNMGLSAVLTVKAARTYGNDTESVVVVELEQKAGDQTAELTDTFRLRREADGWKILASPISNVGAPPSIVAMMMTDTRMLGQAKTAAKRTVCLSNVKQLALGTMLYANDNDDRLPNANAWRAAITPYLKNDGLFHCPEDASGAVSYRMNPNLSRIHMVKVAEPANTVMIYEGDASGFIPRHGGSGNVAFVDGHAKAMPLGAYNQQRHKP